MKCKNCGEKVEIWSEEAIKILAWISVGLPAKDYDYKRVEEKYE